MGNSHEGTRNDFHHERWTAFKEKYGVDLAVTTMNYAEWTRHGRSALFIDLSGEREVVRVSKLREAYASAVVRTLREQPEDKQEEWFNGFLSDQESLQESLAEFDPFHESSQSSHS